MLSIKMSGVAVFVFLLDNLTGFNNALNDTLFQNAQYIHSDEASPVVRDCDPVMTDQILGAVSQDLDLVIVPPVTRNDNEQSDEKASEIFGIVLADNSLPEADVSRSFDENKSKYDNDLAWSSRRSLSGRGKRKNVAHEGKNKTKVEFPNSAPFLVAIFETLANVTAQTCAGTLLTSRWVLTAANCINVLSNLHAINNINVTEKSRYTIVAESSNPLMDGTAHNVTSVVLHPRASNSSVTGLKEEEDTEGSYLALMRIEPEVRGPGWALMNEEVVKGDVMVYGWVLSSKNASNPGQDAMESSSALSQILRPKKCQTMYSYKNNDVLCLSSEVPNVTQLSTGGPVMMVHDGKVKILAVVQTDDDVFVSYPVAPHHDWILHTINNK